jgi:hypothetical protein
MPRLTLGFRPLTDAVLAITLIACGGSWTTSQVVLAQSRSLFVSVTDADGATVTDLTAEEMVVRSDGVVCETLSLEPVGWPVRVTVFVDNNRTLASHAIGDMREGLRLFLDALPANVEVGLATIAERPQFVTPHTSDREALATGIGLLAPIPGAATFLDALVEEAERLDEDEERGYFPVIVMVATSGEEGSNMERRRPFERMMLHLRDGKATVHTRLFAPTSFRRQGRVSQIRWGIDISRATGGSYESLSVSSAFRNLLAELGRDIARKHRLVSTQYRVTCEPPDGASATPAIFVGTTRSGLDVLSTTDGNLP